MAIESGFVRSIFASLASAAPGDFLAHVADDVSWTVLGTHPLAGHYASKRAFGEATGRLSRLFDGGLKLSTRQVLVDGDWAAVELSARAVTRGGIPFNNDYCWVCRFRDRTIVEVRAYLDSALVAEVIDRGEGGGSSPTST